MDKIRTQENFIGRMLCYIGWAAVILGALDFLLSIGDALEMMEYSSELGSIMLTMAIAMPIVAVVGGFVFFGFSEVIRLLSVTSASVEDGAGKPVDSKQLPRL